MRSRKDCSDSIRIGITPIKALRLQRSAFHALACQCWQWQCYRAASLEPEQEIAPLSVTVSEDNSFNQLFKRCGPGWTGGDSTYSTALSPTQVLWLFSDTFIGPVSRDGKRNPDGELFVQGNTLVLQDKTSGALTTYYVSAQNRGR